MIFNVIGYAFKANFTKYQKTLDQFPGSAMDHLYILATTLNTTVDLFKK